MLRAALAVLTLSLLLNLPAAATTAADLTTKESDAMPVEETVSLSYLEQTVEQLICLGFPRDYAEPLAVLSLVHPNWEFEPIFVPETWEEILYYEVDENPARSLITKSEAYAAYRHETNTALYDTGHYQASHAAVSYFMDPRNFLNEKDIFQFYCYAQDTIPADTLTAVPHVLKGSFMENADAGDGTTYAETFVRVGEALGINPIYLAVRALQEQGKAGGMTVGGDGGDLLAKWLAEGSHGAPTSSDEDLSIYNGYYNVFNIKASGTGSYTVLREAMRRAMEGTPEMSEAFGGAPAWDTPAKSIWGGALFIRSGYFNNGQTSAYLQKYNVDPVSTRRFWGQYMQNIVAALGEGRSLYQAYAAAGALEQKATFRIPVYGDIPASCPDPAGGAVDYTELSTRKYEVSADLKVCGQTLTLPEGYPVQLATGSIVTLSATTKGQLLTLSGTVQLDGRLTQLTLTPIAINDRAYTGTPVTVYRKAAGCDTLHLHCSLVLDSAAQVGDTITYLLHVQAGEGNKQAHALPLALLQICVE